MKRRMFDKEIDALIVPTVRQQRHQATLKRALLASSHWEKISMKQMPRSVRIRKVLCMYKNKIILAGASLAIVALAVAGFSALSPNGNVYADRLIEKSQQKINTLSTSEHTQLQSKLSVDPDNMLDEARKAKDLRALTFDQIVAEQPDITRSMKYLAPSTTASSTVMPVSGADHDQSSPAPDKVPEQFKKATYLVYTTPQGARATIAIDQHGIPLFYAGVITSSSSEATSSQTGTVQDN